MKNKWRRYEVLLPVRFNDGRPIPDESLADAMNEVVAQFDAASFYKEAVEGLGVKPKCYSATILA